MQKKAAWNKPRGSKRQHPFTDPIVKVESLSNSGDGIARLEQRVVFIPYTMPGDRVKFKILKEKKSHIVAQLTEMVEANEQRITPQCTYFGECGGCDWQHIPYSYQLDSKVSQLLDTLKRIGGIDNPPMQAIIASESPYHYRNRIQGDVINGVFHFKRKRTGELLAVNACTIADERINDFLEANQPLPHSGRVELALVDDEIQVLEVNDSHTTELGFRQVNDGISAQLKQVLLKTLSINESDYIIDLYCGRGDWTLDIAQHYPNSEVLGIDSLKENIQQAADAAQERGVNNVQFALKKVEDVITKLDIQHSHCIVDPPRAGLDPSVIHALCKNPVASLIYVSCHPATLARDLKSLTESAYQIESIQPLDMFPQTAHLECLVQLRSIPFEQTAAD